MRDCCKDKENRVEDRFKDVLESHDGVYYTVYLCYCRKCYCVIDEETWVE